MRLTTLPSFTAEQARIIENDHLSFFGTCLIVEGENANLFLHTGTSTWILENIELIQNQYLEVVGKFRKEGELIEIEIPRECRDILYKSKHGQWLILVRPKHARRPKGTHPDFLLIREDEG